jgi:hypothetical protein
MWSKKNQITIKPGIQYQNKSLQYLYPSIRLTNKSIYAYLLNNFEILGVGVGDLAYDIKSTLDDTFYILVDVYGVYKNGSYIQEDYYRRKFETGLAMIKQKKGFVTDYTFKDNQHMIVINLPYSNMKIDFLQGNYSCIYPEPQEIDLLFPKSRMLKKIEVRNQDNLVLHKDVQARPKFRELLRNEFGFTEDVDRGIEFDLPPLFKEEVFNHHLLTELMTF